MFSCVYGMIGGMCALESRCLLRLDNWISEGTVKDDGEPLYEDWKISSGPLQEQCS